MSPDAERGPLGRAPDTDTDKAIPTTTKGKSTAPAYVSEAMTKYCRRMEGRPPSLPPTPGTITNEEAVSELQAIVIDLQDDMRYVVAAVDSLLAREEER